MKFTGKSRLAIFVLCFLFAISFTIGVQGKAEAKMQRVAMAGGGPGSSTYVFTGAMAEYIRTKAKIPNLSATAQVSQGFAENIRLVQNGEVEMGMTGSADIYQSLRSLGKFSKEKPYTNLRGMFPAWWGKTHWLTFRDDIHSIMDLKGAHVNIGSPGSGTYSKAQVSLRAAGLLDDVKMESQSWAEGVRLMQDGLVNAVSITMSTPGPAVIQAAATPGKKLRFIEMGEDVIANVLKAHPELMPTIIPKGLYGKDIPSVDYKTFGYLSFVIAHKDVPEEVVYNMVKALLSEDGKKFCKNAEKSVDFGLLPGIETAVAVGMKLHPGVVRYWKEQGVEVPDSVIP